MVTFTGILAQGGSASSTARTFFSTGVGGMIAQITVRLALVLLVVAIAMAIVRAAQGNRQGALRGFFTLFAIAALLASPSLLGVFLDVLAGLIGQGASDANNLVGGGAGGAP